MRLWAGHPTCVIPFLVLTLAIVTRPSIAQTRLTSHEALRTELLPGDRIVVVPASGRPVSGRLMGVDAFELQLRLEKPSPSVGGPTDVTIPLDTIQSLERPRDPAGDGAVIGAGIGAGFAGAMFARAIVIDRNEMDEWASLYLGVAAVFTGIGALVGWATDAAHSKPHIRFDASSEERTKITIGPAFSRGRVGIALAVSF